MIENWKRRMAEENLIMDYRSGKMSETNLVTSIAFVALAENGTIDEVTATEHLDLFCGWASGEDYSIGNLRTYDSKLWKCIQAHRSQDDWTPDVAVSLWVQAGDPTEEWPEWSRPIGAHDAYEIGKKCSHNGKHWINEYDRNIYEPGVYGWREV